MKIFAVPDTEDGDLDPVDRLVQFAIPRQKANITYHLDCVREAIMVVNPTPSSYYEVEFLSDGHIESQQSGPSSGVQLTSLEEITEAGIRHVNGSSGSS